ncbi:MAG: hypothetical protein ACE10H_05240 [Candidatus Binatia bacterium]
MRKGSRFGELQRQVAELETRDQTLQSQNRWMESQISVRCVVDIDAKVFRFCSLRRREPQQQPLLQEVVYSLPPRYVAD